jgi:hypothetical protein
MSTETANAGLIEATLAQWNEIREYAQNLVADLTQEDMIAQPVSGVVMNHPSWVFSHLGVYGPMCANMFRDELAEDPINHRFGRNSRPESDASVYLSKDQLVAHFVDGYDDAAAALRDMDPARLNEPTPIERFLPRFPTIAYLPTQFFLKHTSTHLGQLSAWRRAGRRPPV